MAEDGRTATEGRGTGETAGTETARAETAAPEAGATARVPPPARPAGRAGSGSARRWLFGLLPLALLGGLIALFLTLDPTGALRDAFPPIEELTIARVTFPEPGLMRVHVVNGGPEAVTIAQVQVDEAYWRFELDGDARVPRLGRRTVTLRYPWVEEEPHEIALVTSTGLTFTHQVEVATLTPRPNARYLATFAALGAYAGVIPVLIGLLWFPFLREIGQRWLHFFLSVTVGLLVFLGVDTLAEALETAGAVPGAFQGIGLVAIGFAIAVLALRGTAAARRSRRGAPMSGSASRLELAYLIALGIGLHNLGEGLAIGAAYALGEIALGSFLVIGFALHNTTEGLAIVAPVAKDRPSLWHLAAMGAIAGIPTIAGAWIGGFSYSPIAATVFLALGAGAIFEVVVEVGRMVHRAWPQGLFQPLNAAGLALGLLVMYGTALFVVA